MYKLIFLTGKFKGRRLAIKQGSILIGRDTECHIRLTDDDEVSRKHAILEEKDGGIVVTDPGSLNKILVNDQEVREARLKSGDILQLGKTRIQFQTIEKSSKQEARRIGLVQRITFASVALLLLLELAFLVGLSTWHNTDFYARSTTSIALSTNPPAAKAPAEEPATNAPAMTEGEDTAALEEAQVRLQELEQHVVDSPLPSSTATGELAGVS